MKFGLPLFLSWVTQHETCGPAELKPHQATSAGTAGYHVDGHCPGCDNEMGTLVTWVEYDELVAKAAERTEIESAVVEIGTSFLPNRRRLN